MKSDYDLTKEEWRKICGRRKRVPLSQTEKDHAVRLFMGGTPMHKINFSFYLPLKHKYIQSPIDSHLDGFAKLTRLRGAKRRYRKNKRRSHMLAKESFFRRQICFIARHLSEKERTEFAEDMGFSHMFVEEISKK